MAISCHETQNIYILYGIEDLKTSQRVFDRMFY
jgi:hypothetical protein